MKRNTKRILSLVLTVIMILTSVMLISFSSVAADDGKVVLPNGFMDRIDSMLKDRNTLYTNIKSIRFLELGDIKKFEVTDNDEIHMYFAEKDFNLIDESWILNDSVFDYIDLVYNVEAWTDLAAEKYDKDAKFAYTPDSIMACAVYDGSYPNPGYVVFITSQKPIKADVNAQFLFGVSRDTNTISGPVEITGFKNIDTSDVENMSGFFWNCPVTKLDLSGLDVSSVTDMSYMFFGCENLRTLDLSALGTSDNKDATKVEYMQSMFSGCKRLAELDMTYWDFGSVKNINGIFNGCASLKYLRMFNINDLNSDAIMGGNALANPVSVYGEKMVKYCPNIWNYLGTLTTVTEVNGGYSFKKTEEKISLNIGETYVIKDIEVTPFFEAKLEPAEFKYVSADRKIATVDSIGNIKAISAGKTTITVFSNNATNEITYTLTVVDPDAEDNSKPKLNVFHLFVMVYAAIMNFFNMIFGG